MLSGIFPLETRTRTFLTNARSKNLMKSIARAIDRWRERESPRSSELHKTSFIGRLSVRSLPLKFHFNMCMYEFDIAITYGG